MTEPSDKTTSNVDRLRAVMAEHNLSRRQTAEFLNWPQTTLDSYLVPEGRPLHRRMPDTKRQLLDFHFMTRQLDLQRIKGNGVAHANRPDAARASTN